MKKKNECVTRLLDVVGVVSGGEGEAYAEGLKDLLLTAQDSNEGEVLEGAIEVVLIHLRNGDYPLLSTTHSSNVFNVLAASDSFRISCAGNLLAYAADVSVTIGPTYAVLFAALACEFSGKLSSTNNPVLIEAMATRLPTYRGEKLCLLKSG